MTTSHSHTPGPWRVTANGWHVYQDGGVEHVGAYVATVAHNVHERTPEAAANAKLIAAAPELLVALKAAHTSLLACYDSSEDNVRNPVMRSIGYALENARYAISKAERGQ